MSYDQAVRHFKNHRKDRFFQQCSGYCGNGDTSNAFFDLEKDSIKQILDMQHSFPIYIKQISNSFWTLTVKEDCFGTQINDQEGLIAFINDYTNYSV